MRIAIPSEPDRSEHRVAATPDTVKRFKALGASVAVQAGAGRRVRLPRRCRLAAAGAEIAPMRADTVRDADVVLRVRRPYAGDLHGVKPGAAVIAVMDPYGQRRRAAVARRRGPRPSPWSSCRASPAPR